MFKPSQETIAIVTVGLALAGLDITSGNSIRSEMQAMRAEARVDREAWQAEARALRAEAGADREALGRLTGIVEEKGVPGPSWTIGRKFRDCAECPEMVVAPPGSYMMGSSELEEGRHDNEGPAHRVTIGNLFAVGVYEVTFQEWDACVSDGGCGGYRPDDKGRGRGRHPVVKVRWEDAQAYVRWLSGKTGYKYRLLSESEWEYVARAGTAERYHFGSRVPPPQANYRAWGYGKPVPVGSYAANAFGLHDMHGNVSEWVEDCWNGNYHGAPVDGSAWETGDCDWRVLRGGVGFDEPRRRRSAHRDRSDSRGWSLYVGFRVARMPTP